MTPVKPAFPRAIRRMRRARRSGPGCGDVAARQKSRPFRRDKGVTLPAAHTPRRRVRHLPRGTPRRPGCTAWFGRWRARTGGTDDRIETELALREINHCRLSAVGILHYELLVGLALVDHRIGGPARALGGEPPPKGHQLEQPARRIAVEIAQGSARRVIGGGEGEMGMTAIARRAYARRAGALTCVPLRDMSKMIQVRHVQDDLHRRLTARAALEGLALGTPYPRDPRARPDVRRPRRCARVSGTCAGSRPPTTRLISRSRQVLAVALVTRDVALGPAAWHPRASKSSPERGRATLRASRPASSPRRSHAVPGQARGVDERAVGRVDVGGEGIDERALVVRLDDLEPRPELGGERFEALADLRERRRA